MAAPANDNLANAQVLVAGTTQVTGNNAEATIESGEVRGQGDGTSPYITADFTVWFRWIAPSTAAATINCIGTTFDTYLTIWQAKSGFTDPVTAVANIEIVASNDDGGGSGTSSATFTPVAGRTYYVQLAGFNFSNSGAYTLNYTSPAGPLDRNFGTFNTTASFNVTRSTGSFGTGTTIVVAVFGNTIVSTPGGWTQRTSSVADMGLYSYDKVGAGESSIAFTCSTGSGVWFAWELAAGSSFLSPGSATQGTTGSLTFTSGTLTPTAGNRHLLAVAGGIESGSARSVTSWSDSFIEWADTQVAAQDWPFAAGADRYVVADGVTGYSTTATYSNTSIDATGAILLAYSDPGVVAPTGPVARQLVLSQAVNRSYTY